LEKPGPPRNTPFREVLQVHDDYWVNVEKCEKIPDLEIYVIYR
jgi:hypothetical protein